LHSLSSTWATPTPEWWRGKTLQNLTYVRFWLLETTALEGKLTFGDPLLDSGVVSPRDGLNSTPISIQKCCFLKLVILKRSNFGRTTKTKHAKSGVCSSRINFRKQYFISISKLNTRGAPAARRCHKSMCFQRQFPHKYANLVPNNTLLVVQK
jgi:hypothetical protein